MARFKTMRAKHISSQLFLYKFLTRRPGRLIEKQIVYRALWFAALDSTAAIAKARGRSLSSTIQVSGRCRSEHSCNTVRHTRMSFRAFICGNRFRSHANRSLIAGHTRLDEVYDEIAARHKNFAFQISLRYNES